MFTLTSVQSQLLLFTRQESYHCTTTPTVKSQGCILEHILKSIKYKAKWITCMISLAKLNWSLLFRENFVYNHMPANCWCSKQADPISMCEKVRKCFWGQRWIQRSAAFRSNQIWHLTSMVQIRGTCTNDLCDLSAKLFLFYSRSCAGKVTNSMPLQLNQPISISGLDPLFGWNWQKPAKLHESWRLELMEYRWKHTGGKARAPCDSILTPSK